MNILGPHIFRDVKRFVTDVEAVLTPNKMGLPETICLISHTFSIISSFSADLLKEKEKVLESKKRYIKWHFRDFKQSVVQPESYLLIPKYFIFFLFQKYISRERTNRDVIDIYWIRLWCKVASLNVRFNLHCVIDAFDLYWCRSFLVVLSADAAMHTQENHFHPTDFLFAFRRKSLLH